MTFHLNKQRGTLARCFLLITSVLLLTGCSSPPSVLPLLKVSERTLRHEADRLDADRQRDAQWLEQTRQALEHAYQQDLQQQDELTVAWVTTATQAYVAAREELARHEMERRQQRVRRRDNLLAAADATRRAAAILAQQDRLIAQFIDENLWGLIDQQAE